ncbi:thiol reductant ABC exporter subunit CydD [Ktedonobacteria bacterium brp13]|nr:thiol reductant ABC exporter subunit CydD [Ktedonobacteria bacterium brp13]
MPKEIFQSIKQAKLLLIAAVVLGLIWTLVVIVQMSYLANVIGRVFTQHQNTAQVSTPLMLLLVTILGRALLTWIKELCAQESAIRVKTELRERLFAHLLQLGPAFARHEQTGELVATLNDGIERMDAYISRYLPQIYLSAGIPLLIFIYLLSVDWISAALLFITAPIIPLMMILIGRIAEEHTQKQWLDLSRMSAHFLDAIQGLPTLKIFGRSQEESKRIKEVSETFRQSTMKVLRVAFLSGMVLEFMAAMAIALVAVMLGIRLLNQDISFEKALLVLLLAPEFYRPLRDLGTHRHAGMEGKAAAQRINEILNTPLQLQNEPATAVTTTTAVPDTQSSPSRPSKERVAIEFTNVGYSYAGTPHPALDGINLTLPAASCTALVGRSGAGKSTLVNVLLRFMDNQSGAITVNGLPIHELSLAKWRELIALVPQRPYLFYGSVEDNIRMARPTATQQELEAAAELAGAAEFITQLPQGYATPLGERGTRLSMGQAQRISIARAFLKDAPLLILDEPTSSLDPRSEALIQQALEQLMHERTVLVIAHRYNTIKQATQIAILEKGRLIEVGTQAALLSQRQEHSAFARLLYTQTQRQSQQEVSS